MGNCGDLYAERPIARGMNTKREYSVERNRYVFRKNRSMRTERGQRTKELNERENTREPPQYDKYEGSRESLASSRCLSLSSSH